MRMTSGATIRRSLHPRSLVLAASSSRGLAVEDLLVGPEQVDGGDDHAHDGHHRPPPVGQEGADQHQELTDEPVEPGHPDGGQHGHGEHPGHHRGRRLQAPQRGDLPGLAPLVDPPDQDEQGGDDEAVVDHLEHPAGQPLAVEGEGAEHDEADLGQRRVGQQALQVALGAGHDGPVQDADHGQGQQPRGQRPGGLGEQVEVEADDPVGAQLGHDARRAARHRRWGPRRRRRATRCGTGRPGP